jgi:hypothetical protein
MAVVDQDPRVERLDRRLRTFDQLKVQIMPADQGPA